MPATVTLTDSTGANVTRDDITNRFGISTVTDEATGDTILRIANMLPVEISVNLTGYPSGKADMTVLTGTPRQTDAAPAVSEIDVDGRLTVPGYSFTVVRF